MKSLLSRLLAPLLLAIPSCCPAAPAPASTTGRRVVLVHGFLETGSTFKTLCKRLEKRGYTCLTAKLRPNDGRGGLEKLAEGLKRDIDTRFGPGEPLSIVAFSMGGLVSRHYLQELGGAERCETFITVSSPHHGTNAAFLYPSQGAKQMRPGSDFLARLDRTEDRLGKIPVASYRTPMDLIILPPASSVWQRADNREYPVILHPMMLTTRKVLDDIEQRLAEAPRK